MKHLDLFSGIGGFALAAQWAGHETIGFSEIDPYASRVLAKNFKDVPNFGDVKQLTSMPIYDIIKVCHVLKTLSTTTQPSSIPTECPSRLLPTSTESLDRLCTKYSLGEVLSSVLESREAQTITSTEAEIGRAIMPTTLLNTLSEKVLSNAEQLAMSVEALQGLRTAEQEYKRTTPTITSLLMLCGSVRDAITNGTNTTPLLPAYEFTTENTNPQGIDLLTAGVPCQPASVAGKRRGSTDDRWLWPQTLEIVRVFRPRWVILENVGGFITIDNGMALESTCAFLEDEGYEVQPIVIPACAVGAPHRRDRVWIIANLYGTGLQETGAKQQAAGTLYARQDSARPGDAPNIGCERVEGKREKPVPRFERVSWCEDGRRSENKGDGSYISEPLVCGRSNGLPNELDFIGGLIYEESYDKKTESKIGPLGYYLLQEMWKYRELATTSRDIYVRELHRIMPEVPRRPSQGKWYLGAWIKKDQELRDLWEGIYTTPYEKAQDLLKRMSICIRKIERKQALAQNKKRTDRIKCLGNAIVPQVAYEILRLIG